MTPGQGVYGISTSSGAVIWLGSVTDVQRDYADLRRMAAQPCAYAVWRTRKKGKRWVRRWVRRDTKLLH